MQIIHHLDPLRECIKLLRKNGSSLALVPTMGALHEGHMALITEAKRRADHVAVSIFVNPRQFGPKEDLASYPRPAEADCALLRGAGVSLLWMPPVDVMYPRGYATNVSVARLGEGLCGAARPGHFDGVATVVAKLFAQIRPDHALFGEKDWQQLAIIRRMAADLDLNVNVIGVQTLRAADGLALSSRNAYLNETERSAAATLPKTLKEVVSEILAGADINKTLDAAKERLASCGFGPIDYLTLAGTEDCQQMQILDRPARLFVAAWLGRARLIDNIEVSS